MHFLMCLCFCKMYKLHLIHVQKHIFSLNKHQGNDFLIKIKKRFHVRDPKYANIMTVSLKNKYLPIQNMKHRAYA